MILCAWDFRYAQIDHSSTQGSPGTASVHEICLRADPHTAAQMCLSPHGHGAEPGCIVSLSGAVAGAQSIPAGEAIATGTLPVAPLLDGAWGRTHRDEGVNVKSRRTKWRFSKERRAGIWDRG